MTPREAFQSALDNLAAHKLRSALTMLGTVSYTHLTLPTNREV